MPHNPSPASVTLGDALKANRTSPRWTLWGAHANISLNALAEGSTLGGRAGELAGRSVLVATADQLLAAVALIELDGVARRMVLCPPDIAREHLPAIVADAEVDAIVSDRAAPEHDGLGVDLRVLCSAEVRPAVVAPGRPHQTEWVLLTSGTTGAPKLVAHSLAGLTAAIKPRNNATDPIVWATFYDIRRYGGLQILLRAVLGGAPLILTDGKEPVAQFLARLREHGATHITGTPSHWRRVLWSPAANTIAPRYARMSGEIADQAIIDNLKAVYPDAKIGHAYASTEAGVGFEVNDEREGFPASVFTERPNGVEMKVEDGSLRLRSRGTALRYLGKELKPVADADGFVDTGDMIATRDDRCYFAGRVGGIINVGGLKVYPEEVEAVINRHPDVRVSLVHPKKNPITGAVVIADVVLTETRREATAGTNLHGSDIEREILALCRASLPQHKVPVMISFVPNLAFAESGKLARRNA
jgi:acyl-coenzyme A synthetase/AMP-(fatty) acid ligase